MIQLSRKQTLGLLILCGAVILHATMWPYNFDFRPEFTDQRMRIVNWVPFAGTAASEYKDDVLNTILFIPFGALAYLYRSKEVRPRRSAWVQDLLISFGALAWLFRSKEAQPRRSAWVPALWGMLLSVSVETLQVWLPSRFPSATDVFTNTLGSLLGASAIRVMVDSIGRMGADDFRRAFRHNVMFLILAAYAVVLVASNIYTMDPVGSMAELALRGKGFLRSSWIEDATLAKAAGPILYLGVLTYLTAEWAMLSFPGFRSASTYFIVFLAGSAFALCMETLQVFFRSRVPLRSDILFGAVGCGYGILLHRLTGFPVFRALGDRFTDTASILKFRLPALKPLFLLHYPLLILYAFLYPFDFSAAHFHLDVRALIPFYYHVTNAQYASLYVILRPAITWLPVGIVIAYARSSAKKPFSYLSATLLAAASQLFIETGRAFTEYRYPDVSNVLLAALGAAAGIYLFHRTFSPPPITTHK
ncbi:MAG: VanZ family protein [Desulfobacteria bacterium]